MKGKSEPFDSCNNLVILLKLDSNHQFLAHMPLKFDGWPRKTLCTSSMPLQALCIISKPLVNPNCSYSLETHNSGQNRQCFVPCDLEIWRMTLKNNRKFLLCYIKLCDSFCSHQWIQTKVTVWKLLNWVLTSVTWLDLWALTLTFCMDITSVNCNNAMMLWWWEHSEKGDGWTDRQTDGRKDWTIHRAAWSQLKMHLKIFRMGAILPRHQFVKATIFIWQLHEPTLMLILIVIFVLIQS